MFETHTSIFIIITEKNNFILQYFYFNRIDTTLKLCVCLWLYMTECACVCERARKVTAKFPFCIGNHKNKACIVSSSDTKSVLSPERERNYYCRTQCNGEKSAKSRYLVKFLV